MEANLSNSIPSKYLPPVFSLAEKIEHPAEQPNQRTSTSDTVAISQQAKLAYSQQQTRESSIEIVTRDGDKVTINLSSNESFKAGFEYSNQQTQSSKQTELSAYASSKTSAQYSISIEGSLDSDEREAIERLVHDISEVANKLYDGDAREAFKHASSIEFNTDELESYAFDINQTKSRSFIAAYEEVALLNTDTQTSNTHNSTSIINLTDSLKNLTKETVNRLESFLEKHEIEPFIQAISHFLEDKET